MSTIPSATPVRQATRPPARRRPPGRAIRLALLLLLVLGAPLSAPAVAALAGPVGPIDPQTNFPAYYTDTHGLSLQPCLDGPPLCPTTAADLLGAGAGGEGFYSAVSATAGGIDLGLDLELAYFGPGAGQEVVFARTQYSANAGGLVPGGVYTVTDPYGSTTCTAGPTGSIANTACRTDEGGGPRDFTTALGGRVGPFLTWDSLGAPSGAPPTGYVGDGITEHRVTGSPTGFNRFRVQGPGIGTSCGGVASCEETDLFVVSGKVAPGPAALVAPGSWDFGNLAGPATQVFTLSSFGTQPVTVQSVTSTGPFAAQSHCATVAPGAGCTISVTFTPVPGQFSSGALSVVDNTLGSPRTIPLAGRSIGDVTLTPSSLSFGTQKVRRGPTRPQEVTVSNTGVASLQVGSVKAPSSSFSVADSGCGTLGPGAECTLRVAFNPPSPGAKVGTVDLTTSIGLRQLPVSGLGSGSGRPLVASRTPAPGAHAVARNADVGVRFSERVRHVDGRTFVLVNLSSGTRVHAEVTRVRRASFELDPRRALARDTAFRVALRGGTHGIRDRQGLRLKPLHWKFKTR